MAITLGVSASLTGVSIFLIVTSFLYEFITEAIIKPLQGRVPNNQSTKKAVIATLSDSYTWTMTGMELVHKSGLVLSVDNNFVSAKGLFYCRFNELESCEILKAIDIMRSSKLTTTAVKVSDEEERNEAHPRPLVESLQKV
jgi:hypothetical protein